MRQHRSRNKTSIKLFYGVATILCSSALLSFGQAATAPAQSQVMTTTSPAPEAVQTIPADQLDSLVAPIALYSDPLLANTLAASTYPLEIIQMQQWLARNPNLKDKALADAVAKQNWDPSVQSLAATPEVMQRMADNIQWTTDLGNAFLAQQSDVMDAVQRMRAKAEGKGTLKTSSQQVVQTRSESGKNVIVIENADPQVTYVPSYDPAVVYGAPAYPYYPYSYPGWYPGMGLALGAAVGWGAAYWGGNWGDCNWGGGDVNINNNNNFNRNNWNNNNRPGQGGNRPGNRPGAGNRPSQMPAGGKWNHNPGHRGNAPYGDRGTSNRFGQGNNRPGQGGNRPGAGAGNRPSTLPSGGNRPSAGAGNRPSTRPSGGSRPGGGTAARPSTRPSGGGGANRVGNRTASRGNYGNRGGGYGGRSSGNFARASSSRGGRSMGGGGFSRGGGGGRGGGGRGGGGRGGGGRGGGGGRR